MRIDAPEALLLVLFSAALLAPAASALRIAVKEGSAVQFTDSEALVWSPEPSLSLCAATALLRQGPATGPETRLLRLPARCAVPERALAGPVSLVVIKGRLAVRAGDLERTLKAGGSAFLPARTPHSLRSRTLLRETWVLLSPEAAHGS